MSGLSLAGIMLSGRFCQPIYGKTRDCGRNLQKPLVLGNSFLEPLPGGERRDGLGIDADFLAVERAAPRPRLALARQEGAESDHGPAFALGDVGHDRVEPRIDRLARRRLAGVAGFRGDLHQIGFRYDVWHALSPLRIIESTSTSKHKAAPASPEYVLARRLQTFIIGVEEESPMMQIKRLACAAIAAGAVTAP